MKELIKKIQDGEKGELSSGEPNITLVTHGNIQNTEVDSAGYCDPLIRPVPCAPNAPTPCFPKNPPRPCLPSNPPVH